MISCNVMENFHQCQMISNDAMSVAPSNWNGTLGSFPGAGQKPRYRIACAYIPQPHQTLFKIYSSEMDQIRNGLDENIQQFYWHKYTLLKKRKKRKKKKNSSSLFYSVLWYVKILQHIEYNVIVLLPLLDIFFLYSYVHS